MDTKEQQLVEEIARLKEKLETLAKTDEFNYLNNAIETLQEEKSKLLAEFKVRNAFLKIFREVTQKTCKSMNRNPIRSRAARVATRAIELLRWKTKRILDEGGQETLDTFDECIISVSISETPKEAYQVLQGKINCVREQIEANSQKQNALLASYESARREIKNAVIAKERELQSLRQSLRCCETSPISQPIAPKPTAVFSPHKRKKAKSSKPEVELKDNGQLPAPWKFFIVFNDQDAGIELPPDSQGFAELFGTLVKEKKLFGFDPEVSYNKVIFVTQQTVQERQTMKVKKKGLCKGWRIADVGKKRRLFLKIDEENRQIRLLPKRREKAYYD